MAFPTPLNDLITDSVASTNVEVVSLSPGMAMGELYISTSQALSHAAHNATNAQQQGFVIAQSATVIGVAHMFGIKPHELAAVTAGVLDR
jgi:hypothetical protein